jgi:hypothetical protein
MKFKVGQVYIDKYSSQWLIFQIIKIKHNEFTYKILKSSMQIHQSNTIGSFYNGTERYKVSRALTNEEKMKYL